MKTRLTVALVALITMSSLSVNAQLSAEECATTGSVFYESAKVGNYDAAYEPFMQLRKDCPKWSLALYQLGEKLLKDRIKKGVNKTADVNDLMKLYEERMMHFPSKTKKGDVMGDIAQLKYDNKMGSTMEQFKAFDIAEKTDSKNFTSPKQLYIYFNLATDLVDANQMPLEDYFELYDLLISKIEGKESDMAKIISTLGEKEEAGTITSKESKKLKAASKNSESYGKIKGSINTLLGQRADCENLVPLYEKQFEERKGDIKWVRVAAGRLSAKDCNDGDIFFRLVQQLHNLEPSAKSAFYLGKLAEKDGNSSQALDYYNQSAELETNPSDQAKVYYQIAENFRKKGSYGKARTYYNKALDVKPSMGICYLRIAKMYADSANNCGTDVFSKRAVYWKAAEMARKAGRVDGSLAGTANATASSYQGRAPSKQDIFTSGRAGETISFGCWMGGSVKVPSL